MKEIKYLYSKYANVRSLRVLYVLLTLAAIVLAGGAPHSHQ
jgi:hypothetical protein